MLNDFPSLLPLPARWDVSPLAHLARALGSPRRLATHPPLRAWADEQGLFLEVLMPGVQPEGLQLEVADGALVLRTERRIEPDGEARTTEHRLGLPHAVDEEHARASLRDGVLRLELPRASRPRRIAVEGTEPEAALEVRRCELESETTDVRRSARVRARQTDQAYLVTVEAPGAGKDDLHLTLEGDELRLVAEPAWSRPGAMRATHADYAPAAWTAALHVPEDVDRDAIRARAEAGLVHLELPRRVTPPRRIEIQGA